LFALAEFKLFIAIGPIISSRTLVGKPVSASLFQQGAFASPWRSAGILPAYTERIEPAVWKDPR
jgi:hypothetical protein